ncbi:MAG: aldose epimerase family protein [Pseudomonadota bacterium]
MRQQSFGHLRDRREAQLFTLTNSAGASLSVTNYGCIITALCMPDRDGALANVVLGYDTLAAYEHDTAVMGAFVGRFANRIADGHVRIGGRDYQLAKNKGPHHLHGGAMGFHKHLWAAELATSDQGAQIVLKRTSPDGEENYPGELQTAVVYTLTEGNAVVMDVTATTDRSTIVNVTQHSYFNLSGSHGSVLDHELLINADQVLCTDQDLIPSGEMKSVEGTPFDFRRFRRVGEAIDDPDPLLVSGHGYDHCFVLNSGDQLCARLRHQASGRELTVTTDEPGLQLYTGNWLSGPHPRRSGLCLETQHFPDSPHHPSFPSTALEPGEVFRSRTVYQFSVMPDLAGKP